MSAAVTAAPTLTPDALTGEARALADAVAEQLSGVRRLGVAYSGGVDSATLLALAVRALGSENVVALLGGSAPLAPRIDEEIVAAHALDAVAYGENADDAARHDRPGAGAATRHRVLRPLATAGMTKAQVRDVARGLSLSVADKPAAPCLSSRIPFGQAVTPEKLRQIDALEDAVFDAGFSDCRVRHHGDVARIEVPQDELARALEPGVRRALTVAGKDAGFRHVTLDLDGIRSGLFALQVVRREHA